MGIKLMAQYCVIEENFVPADNSRLVMARDPVLTITAVYWVLMPFWSVHELAVVWSILIEHPAPPLVLPEPEVVDVTLVAVVEATLPDVVVVVVVAVAVELPEVAVDVDVDEDEAAVVDDLDPPTQATTLTESFELAV